MAPEDLVDEQLRMLTACADTQDLRVYADWLEEQGGDASVLRTIGLHPELAYAGVIHGRLEGLAFGLLTFRSYRSPSHAANRISLRSPARPRWALMPPVGPGSSAIRAPRTPAMSGVRLEFWLGRVEMAQRPQASVWVHRVPGWTLLRSEPSAEGIGWVRLPSSNRRPWWQPAEDFGGRWVIWLAFEPGGAGIWIRYRYLADYGPNADPAYWHWEVAEPHADDPRLPRMRRWVMP